MTMTTTTMVNDDYSDRQKVRSAKLQPTAFVFHLLSFYRRRH